VTLHALFGNMQHDSLRMVTASVVLLVTDFCHCSVL